MNLKECTKCKETKPFEEFHKSNISKDGYRYDCKECRKKYCQDNKENIKAQKKEYYQTNKDKASEIGREYYQTNKDKIKARAREYHHKNKDKLSEKAKKYREENKERLAEYKKEWALTNKEMLVDRRKRFYQDNKDKLSIQQKEYYQTNKDKILTRVKEYRQTETGRLVKRNSNSKRRYLRKINSDGTLHCEVRYPLTKELQELLHTQDYKCNNCRSDITNAKHLDHHIPLSKGGTHSINNVVWLCPTCNMTKSDKMPRELMLV